MADTTALPDPCWSSTREVTASGGCSRSMSAPEKTRFVVQNDCIFGYVIPEQPHDLWVLSVSVLRGGGCWLGRNGDSIPLRNSAIPATRQDFKDFRVMPTGYENDPVRYDFPSA